MTTEHALDAAVCAVCELEQGHKGIYMDAYGWIAVRRSEGRYVVSAGNGGYAPCVGHVVDVDWTDGITELMEVAA